MGLCLHWASRRGKPVGNKPSVKGALLLFFSGLKLAFIIKATGLWLESYRAALQTFQTLRNLFLCIYVKIYTLKV